MTDPRSPAHSCALAVSLILGVDLRRIDSAERTAPVAFARQLIAYLLHTEFSLTITTIAAELHRDRNTIYHACGQIEDFRDLPAADDWLKHVATAALSTHQARLFSPDFQR